MRNSAFLGVGGTVLACTSWGGAPAAGQVFIGGIDLGPNVVVDTDTGSNASIGSDGILEVATGGALTHVFGSNGSTLRLTGGTVSDPTGLNAAGGGSNRA